MVLSGSLSEEDMAKMLIDAQENKISDERFKQLSTLRDWLSSLKIQLVELIDTKTLAKNDIDELIDLKTSIESDYNSENIELLNSLVESGKETIENISPLFTFINIAALPFALNISWYLNNSDLIKN